MGLYGDKKEEIGSYYMQGLGFRYNGHAPTLDKALVR